LKLRIACRHFGMKISCVSPTNAGNSSLTYREVTDRLVDRNVISVNRVMRSQSVLMSLMLKNNYEFCLECGNCALVTRRGPPLLISRCVISNS